MNSAVVLSQTSVGSEIEIREGDSFTKVKVIGIEGRRIQVKYPDGTEEWIGQDRLKSGNTDTPTETKSSLRAFKVDQTVEVKRNEKWLTATVQQVTKNWILVREEDERERENKLRWVEPWAVRIVGSGYDIDGNGTRSPDAAPGTIAPKEMPKKSPDHIGDQFVLASEGQKIPTKEQLLKEFETVSFESSPAIVNIDHKTEITTTQPLSAEFSSWALRGVDNRLEEIIPCTGSMKTAVASFPGGLGKSSVVIRTGILGHNQLDTRSLYIPDLRVQSAASDGDVLLTTFRWNPNLQWWKWNGKNYQLLANLQIDGQENIDDASLITPDKAIIRTNRGSVYLLDLGNKKVTQSVKCADGSKLFIHPSGQLAAVASTNETALILKTSDLSIVNELPDAVPQSNIAIDPSGKCAAFVTKTGSVKVMQIEDGKQLGNLSVGGNFNGRLDLVDEKFLLVDGSIVYDIKSGIPVWIYKSQFGTVVRQLINGQFMIAFPGNRMAGIAVASIPDQIGKNAARTASLEKFVLIPGKGVKVDSDFSFFPQDHEKAAELIDQQLKLAGLRRSEKETEDFHLQLELKAGPTEKREYAPDIFTPPDQRKITAVDVPCNILTATLTYKSQPVWTKEIRYVAGSTIQRNKDQSFQDVCNESAIPRPDRLKELNFPSYLPIGAKPGSVAALGSSTLQDRKFVPDVESNKNVR